MSDDKKGAVHLTDDNLQKTLDASDKPVLVDFYADWCGPCQIAAPIIDKLADEYKDKIMISKLNVDENSQSAAKYGVMSIPTVIIFDKKDGKVEIVDKQIGFPGEAGYKAKIDSVLGK